MNPDSGSSINTCLRVISQFVQVFDTEDNNNNYGDDDDIHRSVKDRVHGIYDDLIFREFVDLLCQLSARFKPEDTEKMVDVEFKGLRPQLNSSSSTLDESWALRDISRSSMSMDAWQLRTLMRLHTMAHLRTGLSISSISMNYFANFGTQNLLLARNYATKSIFRPTSDESESRIESLLESFRDDIGSTYEWGGNEMTAYMAIMLIDSYITVVHHTHLDSSVTNLVMQLYRWVVKVTINRELSSGSARIATAKLLQRVADFDINFGDDDKQQTKAGLLLIKMLRDQDIGVKFHLAINIGATFLRFPFVDRIDVYHDMVENLESDEMFSEGFALRAYSLMQLALASDDIRRAAMVNLLELGKFASCKLIVESCFVQIADRLYQGGLANLFFQNSSQFICSWIDFDEDIYQFPFHAFGFPDFDTWTTGVKDELVSQLINADRWDDATNLFRRTDKFENILISCLPRIVSYYYLKTTGSERETCVSDRCKAALGSGLYQSTLISNFAKCLAILVERLDDKTLNGEDFASIGLVSSSSTLSLIALPDPGPSYPETRQPCFSMLNVITAIEQLRQTLKIPLKQVWDAPKTIFVVRHLVDEAITASDTTIVISSLRRIAFVLCIADSTVNAGYPFEMLLFGLRNFIDSPAACKTALQIVKFLLSQGESYIIGHPDRLRQIVTVLLPRLQALSSTVPENPHCVYDFYNWLAGLVQITSPGHDILNNTLLLLEFMNKAPESKTGSVGQMVERLVEEDSDLWSTKELQQFALDLLSSNTVVFNERLSSIARLTAHFLDSDSVRNYLESSKLWLGLGLGTISRDIRFSISEYKPKELFSMVSGADDSCSATIFGELCKFMRLDCNISGLLEQALRDVSNTPEYCIPKTSWSDQSLMIYLSSNHIPPKVDLPDRLQFPPPSEVEAWTNLAHGFASWYKGLACSLAQHLQAPLFLALVPALDFSLEFCQAVFPYLVDQYRIQKYYDGSITNIFNAILRTTSAAAQDYLRLIIRIILFLRERSAESHDKRRQPLIDEIDYLRAAGAAVTCKMYKTALMFLEIAGKQGLRQSDTLAQRILSDVYRGLDDPDMAYALTQNATRTWNDLLDVYKLHNERAMMNDLRRARLRTKVESGVIPSFDDDDLRAVADYVRQNGYPLKFEGIAESESNNKVDEHSSVSLYKSAWRLGIWDLPALPKSKDSDTLIYSVLYQLVRSKSPAQFFPVLNSAIIRTVDLLCHDRNPIDSSKAVLSLSMFANIAYLFSSSQSPIVAGKAWGDQISRNASYGRHNLDICDLANHM